MLRNGTDDAEGMWDARVGMGTNANANARASTSASAGGGASRTARIEKLHRRLKRIVKARGALDAQEAEALRDADALRVWRHYGYSSLLEYMEMEMGYTPRAAVERLRVAKAVVDLPAIADAMAQGDLSFSAGRELTRVATAETEGQWLEAANDKNMRQVEDLVSGHKHGDKPTDPVDPKLRKRRLRYDDIDEETVVSLRQAQQILERELGERMTANQFLRAVGRMVIDGARGAERTHAPYQIAVMTCPECRRGWQDGGGLTIEMSPAKLEAALCDAQHIGSLDDDEVQTVGAADDIAAQDITLPTATDGECIGSVDNDDVEIAAGVPRSDDGHGRLSTHVGEAARRVGEHGGEQSSSGTGHGRRSTHVGDAARRVGKRGSERSRGASTDGPPQVRPSSDTALARKRASSDIPPALRRKVKARDHGRCRVSWCRSSRNVDQHHLVPRSQGGEHTLENIISLCESHHLAHHEGALVIEGTASNPTFTRRAHNTFAIAERSVETTLALRSLGFDKREVAEAMDKTRTHVGTSELTLEQWIKIALGYCPKPRT